MDTAEITALNGLYAALDRMASEPIELRLAHGGRAGSRRLA